MAVLAAVSPPPVAAASRAELRSSGGDRATALRIATALLAQKPDLQLLHVRCEPAAGNTYCGLTLSGVHFHRRLERTVFERDVDTLVRLAFAVDARIAEVDLWVSVPASAGTGAIVSGDFAMPTSATVYATTVPRAQVTAPSAGANVFWDPAFRRALDAGWAG